MKNWIVGLCLAAGMVACGATRTVNNVDELYAALAELSNGPSMNYITLNAGTYDVSGRTYPGPGDAHLGATNIVFQGATGNREDVLVFGDMTRPVFGLYSGGARHLTVSNGTRGVVASGSGSQMTNLIVTCCSNKTLKGGAGYQGTWRDCLIVGNCAQYGGGLYSCTAYNCIITNNQATGNGGGVYGGTTVESLLTGNRAANGGGAYEGTIRGGRIELNDADYQGGGMYGSVISNKCVIYGNSLARFNNAGGDSRYGAGARSGSVYDSMIIGNAVLPCPDKPNMQGGGAYNTSLYDCLVANNYSAGLSSGINSGKAVRCVISNNVTTSAQGFPLRQLTGGLVDCVVYNEFCNSVKFANRCKFIGFTGTWTLTAADNPHTNGTFTTSTTSLNLLYAGNSLTNCLVANNTAGRLFCSSGPSKSAAVNCTFVDNCVTYYGSDFTSNGLTIANCIFAGNKKVDGSALSTYFEGRAANHTNVTLNCCAFDKPVYSKTKNKTPAFQSNIYQFSDMKFDSKNEEHPYSLRWGSPARGLGELLDWTDGDLDIRNDAAYPRLRDGKVDLGCYQCWLDPIGFKFCIQ